MDQDQRDAEREVKANYPDIIAKAETAYLNFLTWKRGNNFELVTMEVPCVSEEYQYGTTLDVIAKVNGRLSDVEVKTSKGIHEDFLIQMAAQKHAWDESHDEKIDGFHLLHLNKEHGAFTHKYWEALPGCFEAFLALRELHDLKKQIKKLI